MTPAQRRFAQAQKQMEDQRLREQMMAQILSRRPQAQQAAPSAARQALSTLTGSRPTAQEPVKKANGGMITSMPRIPSLMELAQPNFELQQAQVSEAPFTQQNPVVPMVTTQSPAFGGMPQDVYNWTPSEVMGSRLMPTPRQPPAMTTSTSTYTPVDVGYLGGMNIPSAEDLARSAVPKIITERRAEEERQRQEQEYQAEMERARVMQMEELIRRQKEFEAQLMQQQEATRMAQQDLTGFQSTFDQRVQQGIAAELQRRQDLADAQARAKAQADAKAAADAAAAAEAERQRQAAAAAAAAAAEREKALSTVRLLTGGYDSIFDAMSPQPQQQQSTPWTQGSYFDASEPVQPSYDLGYGNN